MKAAHSSTDKMNNSTSTPDIKSFGSDVAVATTDIPFQVLWLCGIAVSILCHLVQIIFFILIRASRKTDEKILAQITFTRIVATSCEYYIMYGNIISTTRWLIDFIFGLYFASDFAIVCWMLVFTKHLYDKIVVVFNTSKPNLVTVTVTIWAISSPFGIVAVYLLKYHPSYFTIYCNFVYVILKFLIQTFNSLIYIRVFYVALKRGEANSGNLRSILKTAFVAFLLITTTCIQILVTDIIAIISGSERNEVLVKSFCIINSFHVVPLMVIFIIILKGKMRQSITKTLSLRLSELNR